jgi:FG-GAP-like repeat
VRTLLALAIYPLLVLALCTPLSAQSNPIPFVNNPLVPASAAPGSSGLTLTANGAGFAPGAIIKWNGTALQTTVVSHTQVTALVPASDLLTAGTIPVTVSNPAPGGGSSNVILFEITTATTSLAFTSTETDFPISSGSTISMPSALAVGYFSDSSSPLLSIADQRCPAAIYCPTLGEAAISTARGTAVNLALTAAGPQTLIAGDTNGDGIFDLITLGTPGLGNLSVSLGNGDGSFQAHQDIVLPAGANPGVDPALGDFNQDGKLDLVLAANGGVIFLPGNGDGTFGAPGPIIVTDATSIGTYVTAGDFNGDGVLDLAVSNIDLLGGSISILLGNGDGTFLLSRSYPFSFYPGRIAAADFNGDGKLDLAVFDFLSSGNSMAILLGNGDGSFQPKVDYPVGVSPVDFALGDYNGDGIVDIAVADSSGSVNVLLGNGDGTLQSHLDFATQGSPGVIASAEFSYFSSPVGRTGFAVTNPNRNTVSIFAAIPMGVTNPLPAISSIFPTSAIQGSGAFSLTINGSNFVSASVVSFGGQLQPTTYVNSSQLTVQISSTAIATAGPVAILVATPAPGGWNSTSASFNIYLPPPQISSISPTSVAAGSPSFTLTINGANFVPGSMLNVIGTVQSVTFTNATQVTATIPAAIVAAVGSVSLSITNPLDGAGYPSGGTSSTVTLEVLTANSQPTIGTLSPASTTVGGPNFPLTLTGTGFTPSSIVTFGSATVSSAFQSPTTLTASIPASAIATAGTPYVTVVNPGGKPSVVLTFTVNNPVPMVASVSPSTVAPGSPALTLTVTGTNFNSSSVIQVSGSARPTTLISSTALTAALPASDFINNGASNISLNILVVNPAPGGGLSSAWQVTVPDFIVNAPTSAIAVTAGQPGSFTLVVAPSKGVFGSPVIFSASTVPPNATATFSPTSLPSGSMSTTVTLMITTMPHTAGGFPQFPRTAWPRPLFLGAFSFMMGIIWLGFWAANIPLRRYAPQILAVLLLAMVTALAACGATQSSFSPVLNPASGTPAGTYPITVTAVSGNASLTTNITLTVN